MQKPLILAAGFGIFLACTKEEKVAPPVTPPPVTPRTETPPSPPPAAAPTTAILASRAGFYKQATKDSKIDDGTGKKVSNWISLLHRGEKVDLLENGAEFTKVRASDGSEGWVTTSSLLTTAVLADATVVELTQAFDRPDLVAVSKTQIEPGTILFVLEEKAGFRQVNYRGTRNLWVMADKLSTDNAEIQMARFIERSRYLMEKEKGEGTQQLLSVAKSQFASAKLMPVLEQIVAGNAPPVVEGEAPSGEPSALPPP